MKIAIVTESFYPCGVLVVVEDLFNHLQEDPGFDPIYIGPRTPFNRSQKGVWLPSKIVSKSRSYYRTLIFSLSTGRMLRDALADVDLIHLHSISILSLRTILLVKKINKKRVKKIKILFHMHTQADEYLRAWYGIFSPLFIYFLDRVVSFCIRNADHIIFPTDFFRKIISKKFLVGESKFSVWPAPVEVDPNKRINCDLPKPYLSYVGRIVEEKNIKSLIDFFVKFKRSIKDLSLVLVGDGDISKYKNYAMRYPEAFDNILFLGQKSHDEVCAINKNALAGISLSLSEVQGLAVLEQMAVGIPVIVLRNTCWESIVEDSDGGYLLDDSDNFQVKARALSGLSSQGLVKGRNGKAYISEELNRKTRFNALSKIYQDLLAS